jgi:simple sugar transport system permease protein
MTLLSILGVFSSAIFSGTSLLYTTLGEVIDERAGIVNLGLEGVLLVSAASGFAVTSLSGNPYLGILVSMLAGGLMNMGFMGFMICWLAGADPLGIILMAFVVSVIYSGGNLLQLTRGLPYSVINILLAFTLFIVLARPNLSKRKKT